MKYLTKIEKYVILYLVVISTLVYLFLGGNLSDIGGKVIDKITFLDIVKMNRDICVEYETRLSPAVCQPAAPEILILVSSTTGNSAARSSIRETWGKTEMNALKIRIVFIVGASFDLKEQEALNLEGKEHDDLLQGQFDDNDPGGNRTALGFSWSVANCSGAEFIVKVDDHMFVDVYALHSMTRNHLRSEQYQTNEYIFCSVLNSGLDQVIPLKIWWKPEEPIKTGALEVPYCKGGFYVLNPGTAARLLTSFNSISTVAPEDNLFTGILAQRISIKLMHDFGLYLENPEQLIMLKVLQHADRYHQDFVATRTLALHKYNSLLARYAQNNYQSQSLNNLYFPTAERSEEAIVEEAAIWSMFSRLYISTKNMPDPMKNKTII